MYSDFESGVRIKLPKYPFINYSITKTDLPKSELSFINDFDVMDDNLFQSSIFTNSYWPICPRQRYILHEVKYTDDIDLLIPKIFNDKDNITDYSFGKLGIYKNKHWEFQNEWRYILHFQPFGFMELYGSESHGSKQKSLLDITMCPDLPFKIYYLYLREEAVDQMEILLAPKINPGNAHLVETLVKEHNQNINIRSSSLTGKLR